MSASRLEARGFFASLFDFGFTSFVTLKFLKLIYTILVVLICLAGVIFLIGGLAAGGGTAVAALFLAPLMTLLYLIFARIYMEIIALFFRMGENTTLIATALTGAASGGASSLSTVPPPPPPTYGSAYPPQPTYGSPEAYGAQQTYGGQSPTDLTKPQPPPPTYGGPAPGSHEYRPPPPPSS